MRKKKWDIGQEYNGWIILSTKPHTTPNGTRRYQCTVKCSKCGYQKTTTQPISKLSPSNCPHKGMGIRKVTPYERVYRKSGEGIRMDERIMFKLNGDMLKTIDKLSDEMKLSRSGFVRCAVREFIIRNTK